MPSLVMAISKPTSFDSSEAKLVATSHIPKTSLISKDTHEFLFVNKIAAHLELQHTRGHAKRVLGLNSTTEFFVHLVI